MMSPGSAVDVPGFQFPAKIPIYAIFLQQQGCSGCTFAQSDQLLFRCLDEHASWNRKYCCKPQTQFYSLSGPCVH